MTEAGEDPTHNDELKSMAARSAPAYFGEQNMKKRPPQRIGDGSIIKAASDKSW